MSGSDFAGWEGWDNEEEIETCPEGYNPFEFGECCGCVMKRGIECCDFCPFGSIPLCGEEQGKKCEEELSKNGSE